MVLESDQWLSFWWSEKLTLLLQTAVPIYKSWLNEWFLIETYPTTCQNRNAMPISLIELSDQKYVDCWTNQNEIFICCCDHLIKENYPPTKLDKNYWSTLKLMVANDCCPDIPEYPQDNQIHEIEPLITFHLLLGFCCAPNVARQT